VTICGCKLNYWSRQVNRRDFLKLTATATAAATVPNIPAAKAAVESAAIAEQGVVVLEKTVGRIELNNWAGHPNCMCHLALIGKQVAIAQHDYLVNEIINNPQDYPEMFVVKDE